MKTFTVLAAASLVLVGCEQRDTTMNEAAGSAQDQIEQQAEAQKESIEQKQQSVEQSAEQSQEQITEQAKAEKERIEAQAEAQKAELEAQKESVEAQAQAEQADIQAQQKAQQAQQEAAQAQQESVEEAAGAQAGRDQGTSDADKQLSKQVRQSLMGTGQTADQTTPATTDLSTAANNIMIMSEDGKVTLTGFVQTEAQKMEAEQRAKKVSGVTSVENKLEVKGE